MQTFNRCVHQRGTVMVYILVAIGLFSALTYAISSGNRTNTSAITEQQANLTAQEIIEFGNSVATAVQKIKLRGFADTEIGFGNSIYQRQDGTLINAPGHNANCTSDACEVFNVNGGGIEPLVVQQVVDNPVSGQWTPGHFGAVARAVKDIGEDNQADLVWHTTNLPLATCVRINELLGVTNPSDVPPSFDDTVNGANYNGTYPVVGTVIDVADINGKTSFCYERSTAAGRYMFYQVLITR